MDPVLFAIRETPKASTGYAPFELLYGCKPRGIIQLTRDNWTQDISETGKPVDIYLQDLRSKLEEARNQAQEHLRVAQDKQKQRYDRGTMVREFQQGEMVLVNNRVVKTLWRPLAGAISQNKGSRSFVLQRPLWTLSTSQTFVHQ